MKPLKKVGLYILWAWLGLNLLSMTLFAISGFGNSKSPSLDEIPFVKKMFSIGSKETVAVSIIDRIINEDFQSIFKSTTGTHEEDLKNLVQKFRTEYKSDPFINYRLISFSHNVSSDTDTLILEAERKSNDLLLVKITTSHQDGDMFISGVKVISIEKSLAEKNSVSVLHPPNILGPIFIILAFAVPLLIAFSFYKHCTTNIIQKRRFLWGVFIILGFVSFNYNWSDGAITIFPFYLITFGTQMFRDFTYEPLIIAITIPFGACIFLIKYARRHKLPARGSIKSPS